MSDYQYTEEGGLQGVISIIILLIIGGLVIGAIGSGDDLQKRLEASAKGGRVEWYCRTRTVYGTPDTYRVIYPDHTWYPSHYGDLP